MPTSNTPTQNYGFAYQGEKLRWLEGQAERVVRDSHEAGRCVELEAVVRDLVDVFEWIFETDIEVRTAFATGVREYDPEFEELQTGLLEAWVERARKMEGKARGYEAAGYEVVGIEELRRRIHETSAILNPSRGVNGLAENAAALEHRRGETEEFPASKA